MATNSPSTASVEVSPVATFSTARASTVLSPSTSVTTVSHRNEILSLWKARSCMIFEARSWLRRWTTVTLVANFVRNSASSMAESPPPTTAISLPRKKNPSQVAQVDTPWPRRRASLGSSSISERAPVLTMTARARCSSSSTYAFSGDPEKSTLVTLRVRYSAPNRAAWARNVPISSGPMIPSMKPG